MNNYFQEIENQNKDPEVKDTLKMSQNEHKPQSLDHSLKDKIIDVRKQRRTISMANL